ncbi:MAG: DUF547 domain-containing protein [Bryobacteraceae bacterium]
MVTLLLAAALAASPGIDHEAWDRLVRRYVNEAARVDYVSWKNDGLPALDAYLATLAQPWPASITPAGRKAASINAYNALVVRWILANYPVQSIWKTDDPFRKARHRMDGRALSLDQIENQLRALGDPRVHAVLVCAARSCPPLRREAYREDRLDAQMDDNARAWLSNEVWNRFEMGAVEVSPIFDWFGGDFKSKGQTLRGFLARYGPPGASQVLDSGTRIRFRTYDWGLNDAGRVGEGYRGVRLWWDVLKNKF